MSTANPSAPTKSSQLHSAYRHAKAALDLAIYGAELKGEDVPREIEESLGATYTDALNAYLLQPAETPGDFRTKMVVFRDEEIVDSWTQGAAVATVMCEDARRCIA